IIGGPTDLGETGPSANVIWGNFAGVLIAAGAHDNQVGDVNLGHGNVISNNSGPGVWIAGSNYNRVEGNVIGADPFHQSTWLAATNEEGVLIEGQAANNTIGGTGAGAGNFILSNRSTGVVIDGTGTNENKIQGNSIGIGPFGPLPNVMGVSISLGASG